MPTLYLLPVNLADGDPRRVLPAYNLEVASRLRHFVVENVRTARRFLKRCDPSTDISRLSFAELNVKTSESAIPSLLAPLEQGHDLGIMSEAGCPAIADPGAKLVALAQQRGFRVEPLVGPSSILLSLMASGFNGQGFTFHGYLPIEPVAREKAIKGLEQTARTTRRTQIFIETPYRNSRLMQLLLRCLKPSTMLCVGSNITSPTAESILSMPVAMWKTHLDKVPDKVPAIFLIY